MEAPPYVIPPSLMAKILRVGLKTGKRFCITIHAARGEELKENPAELKILYELGPMYP